MTYIARRWKIAVVLVLSLLLTGLACVEISRAQIKKEDVDFEVLATVTMVKGDTLWELAQKYYDDPYRWKIIMDMNKIPDERRIPIGTVIYIPVEDAKKIVKEVEKEIEVKKAAVDITAEELAKLRAEVADLKAKLKKCQAEKKKMAEALKKCQAKNKKLTQALEDKNAKIKAQDATIEELQAMLKELKALVDKLQDEVDQLAEEREEQAKAQRKKDELIEELEAKIRRQRREIEELEEVNSKLKARIREAEEAHGFHKVEKPAKPVKEEPVNQRAMVAAVAIALLGSILWIFSD